MILSMTGYGRAEYIYSSHKTIVELRSVNSKQLDLTLKATPYFREHEMDIKSLLAGPLERGKVDVSIYTTDIDSTETSNGKCPTVTLFTPINKEAFKYYYKEIKDIYSELGIKEPNDLTSAILALPDVSHNTSDANTMDEEEWALLKATIKTALDNYQAFRIQEGGALEKMFNEKLSGIMALLSQIEPYENGRVENIKQHLLQNLETLSQETKQQIDRNRLEAELIYYLEKLDITEEKVRLTNHVKYFKETMEQAEHNSKEQANVNKGVGKKLGFIAQEMGREINTLGSKSNQSEMQIIVVQMKDILEQIKEQVLNVL